MSTQSITTEEKFWRNVLKTDTCWLWTAGKSHGYGAFYPAKGEGDRPIAAHRYSWKLHFGALPKGAHVLHHCDNPPCVRPDHLFTGTQADNMRDKARKGRAVAWNKGVTHCKSGHEFTPNNTYIRTNGRRSCRTCHRRWVKEYRERKRLN